MRSSKRADFSKGCVAFLCLAHDLLAQCALPICCANFDNGYTPGFLGWGVAVCSVSGISAGAALSLLAVGCPGATLQSFQGFPAGSFQGDHLQDQEPLLGLA